MYEAFYDFTRVSNEQEVQKLQTIICDGRSMQIQQNLYEALLTLRLNRPGDYWIDAVCIDQDNLQEKTAQVQMMGNIYHKATRVLVWLGSLPTLLEPSFDSFAAKWDKVLSDLKSTWVEAAEGHEPECTDVDPAEGGPGKADPVDFDEYANILGMLTTAIIFLTRRWWRRLWVVQEYCVAREAVFLLGDQEISLETINSAMENHLLAGVFPQWVRIRHSVTEMLQLRDRYKDGHRWTLTEWLQITKGRKATDARDALFAGMALIDPNHLAVDRDLAVSTPEQSLSNNDTLMSCKDPGRRLWAILHVEYQIGTPEILLNLAACLITNSGWETLFYYTLLLREPPSRSSASFPLHSHPSWIPDPSAWTSFTIEPFFMRKNTGIPFPLPKSASIMGAGPKISKGGSTLFLSAARLDTVAKYRPIGFPADFRPDPDITIQFLKFIISAVPQIYQPAGVCGIEALSNICNAAYRMAASSDRQLDNFTLLKRFCRFMYNTVKHEQMSKAFLLDEGTMQNRRQELMTTWEKVKKAYPDAPWPVETATDNKRAAPLEDQAESSLLDDDLELERYSVFTTQNGYMGLGPSFLQRGDQIFLLVEGKTSYIFRGIDDVLCTREQVVVQELAKAGKKASHAKVKDDLTGSGVYREIEKQSTESLRRNWKTFEEEEMGALVGGSFWERPMSKAS